MYAVLLEYRLRIEMLREDEIQINQGFTAPLARIA